MHFFQLSPLAVMTGIGAVIAAAFLNFHYAFRYQYLCVLVRKRPSSVKRLLERSYLKNRTIVGLLDKSTKEILEGDYDQAEKFIIEGIGQARQKRTLQSQFVSTTLYRNLSWILYYKGHYKESLQVAISLYEKAPTATDMLALISCNFARLGDIQRAVEALAKLTQMKKAEIFELLPCKAEIEAAKGNSEKAVDLLDQAKQVQTKVSIKFIITELEKRISQLQKAV
jgi:tetratricopeptide (TPR) repeat protein